MGIKSIRGADKVLQKYDVFFLVPRRVIYESWTVTGFPLLYIVFLPLRKYVILVANYDDSNYF